MGANCGILDWEVPDGYYIKLGGEDIVEGLGSQTEHPCKKLLANLSGKLQMYCVPASSPVESRSFYQCLSERFHPGYSR